MKPVKTKQQTRIFFSWWLISLTILIATGCATGPEPGWQDPKYGNPGIKHVKELPQNRMNVSDIREDSSPMTSPAHEKVGDAMLVKGNLSMAYYHYEKALASRPGDIGLTYKTGVALVKGGKNDAAIQQFRKVLKADAGHAGAYGGLGRAMFQKRTYDAAEQNLLKAVELAPELWREYVYLAMLYDYRKSYTQAAHAYRTALKNRPNHAAIVHNYGVSLYLDGKYRLAASSFKKAIALSFTPEIAYNNLGLALAAMGQYKKALEAFKNGVGEARAYNNLGWVYLHNDMPSKAAESFEKAMAISPVYYATAATNLQIAQSRLRAEKHTMKNATPVAIMHVAP